MKLTLNYERIFTAIKQSHFDLELSYLNSAIEILLNNYEKDFKEQDLEFQKEIEDLKKSGEYDKIDETTGVTYGQMAEYDMRAPFEELESFSNIIIEAMLVKHVAFVESLVVQYAFMVQTRENCPIPPHFPLEAKDKSRFTDMESAAKYINLATKDQLKFGQFKNWKNMQGLRKLRHKLAHGERNFFLKESDIDDINHSIPSLIEKWRIDEETYQKENPSDPLDEVGLAERQTRDYLPNKNNKWECRIGSDINILKHINKICQDFTNEARTNFQMRYNRT